jgi:hypothetical protein
MHRFIPVIEERVGRRHVRSGGRRPVHTIDARPAYGCRASLATAVRLLGRLPHRRISNGAIREDHHARHQPQGDGSSSSTIVGACGTGDRRTTTNPLFGTPVSRHHTHQTRPAVFGPEGRPPRQTCRLRRSGVNRPSTKCRGRRSPKGVARLYRGPTSRAHRLGTSGVRARCNRRAGRVGVLARNTYRLRVTRWHRRIDRTRRDEFSTRLSRRHGRTTLARFLSSRVRCGVTGTRRRSRPGAGRTVVQCRGGPAWLVTVVRGLPLVRRSVGTWRIAWTGWSGARCGRRVRRAGRGADAAGVLGGGGCLIGTPRSCVSFPCAPPGHLSPPRSPSPGAASAGVSAHAATRAGRPGGRLLPWSHDVPLLDDLDDRRGRVDQALAAGAEDRI